MIKFNSRSKDFGWLSNMYPSPLTISVRDVSENVHSVTFKCVESAFQAYKVFSGLGQTNRHPENEIEQFKSFSDLDGAEARDKGRALPDFNADRWNAVRLRIMEFLISQKFRNPDLRQQLVATNGEELLEDSPWDTFWGTRDGFGENHLGKIIIGERSRIMTPEKQKPGDGKHYYAGVGSRRVRPDNEKEPELRPVYEYMKLVARELEKKGYILQSGGAEGSDSAFASGVEDPRNLRVVTPRPENCKGKVPYKSTPEGLSSVDLYHPRPSSLPSLSMPRRLMERNYYQVMGNPSAGMGKVDFVICWAPVKPDGTDQYYGKDDKRNTGGTGQAIRIAQANRIPVYNLYLPGTAERFEKEILGYSIEKNPLKLSEKKPDGFDYSDVSLYHRLDATEGLVRTGSFSNARNYENPVIISRWLSKSLGEWANDKPWMKELAPSEETLREYKNSTLPQGEKERIYAEKFAKELDSKDWDSICKKIQDLTDEKGPVTLLCYERSGDFCHRHAAAERLRRELIKRVKPAENKLEHYRYSEPRKNVLEASMVNESRKEEDLDLFSGLSFIR